MVKIIANLFQQRIILENFERDEKDID